MGLFSRKPKAEPKTPAPANPKPETAKPKAQRRPRKVTMPDTVYYLLCRHTCQVGASTQDAIKALSPFETMSIKFRKQSSRNMPSGWEVDPTGGIVLGADGKVLFTLDAKRMKRYGFEFGKTYHAFMLPPCYDTVSGRCLEDLYKLHVEL